MGVARDHGPRESRESEGAGFEQLSKEDRHSLASLVACLIPKNQRDSDASLRRLCSALRLSPAEQEDVLIVVSECEDPGRFAGRIHSEAAKWGLLTYLLTVAVRDGNYDAHQREGCRKVAHMLGVHWTRFMALEDGLAKRLRREPGAKEGPPEKDPSRRWKVAAAAVSGAAALALTGVVAAPAIGAAIGGAMGLHGAAAVSAGLAKLGGGALAAGGFGMTGGTTVLGFLSGVIGAVRFRQAALRRTAGIKEYKYEPIQGTGMHVYLAVPGFMSQDQPLTQVWAPLARIACHGEHHALRWESQRLRDLGALLGRFTVETIAGVGLKAWAQRALRSAGSRVVWPAVVLEAANFLDHPWVLAKTLAAKAAKRLADDLEQRRFGNRPVSLVGYSLGARVVFMALEELAGRGQKAHGIIDHAILMGGAFQAEPSRWANVRGLVAGRLVNAYSPQDWVLGFLYRAVEREINKVAGLSPANVAGVEDENLSHIVNGPRGHLQYSENLTTILKRVGVDGKPVPA